MSSVKYITENFGKYDVFSIESYMNIGGFSALKKSKKKSTERTIKEITITQEGHLIKFTFVGDGFLYNMVRIMMGTILQIGSGELPLSTIEKVFESKQRVDAGPTAPSHGLFLESVSYE